MKIGGEEEDADEVIIRARRGEVALPSWRDNEAGRSSLSLVYRRVI